jgi:hypothetical protein
MIILAVRAAIIDASPSDANGIVVLQFDAALSALAYMIAAIGVQEKSAATRHGEKTFVKYMADAIEQNVKILRASGDLEPFAPV